MGKENIVNRRLQPKKTDSDYYLLTRLREIISKITLTDRFSKKHINIFDYGCGDAPYKTFFPNKNHLYIAGDIPGNPKANVVINPTCQVPFKDESFDLVLSIQVLEHVINFDGYLTEVHRLLKTYGRLVLSTHGWWTWHPYPCDYWRWTHDGLLYLLDRNGFDVIESYWVLGMLAYSFQLRLQCLKGLLDGKGHLNTFLFRGMSIWYQKLIQISDKITPDNIGKNNAAIYVIVAHKKN